ncbi:MAG: tetratricopeptide repeat protein [Promethearchaeota archaeon]
MSEIEDLFERALSAFSAGDLKRAEELTRRLLDIDEDNIDGLSLLVSIHQQGGDFEKALEPAKRVVELDPGNSHNLNTLGYLHLLLGRWEEGEKCYAHAVTIPGAPSTIFLNYAWALIELGKEEKAIQQLQHALEHSLEGELADMIQREKRYEKLRSLLDKLT